MTVVTDNSAAINGARSTMASKSRDSARVQAPRIHRAIRARIPRIRQRPVTIFGDDSTVAEVLKYNG